MEPVGSARVLPHALHVTVDETCEKTTLSSPHSFHCTFWNLLPGFGIQI
jgi:hypothetical protein